MARNLEKRGRILKDKAKNGKVAIYEQKEQGKEKQG